MKKPVFCINRLRYFRTIIFAANAMFALLCLLTVFPVADDTDHASAEVNGDEYSLTLGMSDSISFDINPTDEGVVNIAKATIIGGTNAPTGYQLYIVSTEEDSSILLEGEEKNTIRDDSRMQPTTGTIAAPEALFTSQDTPATWGFAIPGIGGFDESYSTDNPSTESRFAALPTLGNGQLIHETDAAIDDDTVEVYFGTKVNSRLRHGKYKTWVKYAAVTDMASEVVEGISITPHRIRNNYEAGTVITIKSETRIAADLGVLIATVNNLPCNNIKTVVENPLTITCEIPEGLENGEYDVALEIPQYGKSFLSSQKLSIVDPYDIMQEIDKEVYDSVLTDQSYQFVDARDNKKYYITKLENGNLYMDQNLDFELSPEGTVLSPETSDVNSEKTIIVQDPESIQYVDRTVISHTENIDDTGKKLVNYGNNWGNANIRGTDREEVTTSAHVVSIPGADTINLDVYYNGESTTWDWVRIWKGEHPSYTADTSTTDDLVVSKLGGGCNTTFIVNGNTLTNMCHISYIISADALTFTFRSDGGGVGQGYGYYAIARGTGAIIEGADNPSNFIYKKIEETNEDSHLLPGSLYSLTAAITEPLTTNMVQTESICPKGWHLENLVDYKNAAIGLYGNTSKGNGTIRREEAPLYLVEGKYWGSNFASFSLTQNSVRTITSSAEEYYNNIVNESDNPLEYIRCVYPAPRFYSISYDANGGSNPPEEQMYGGWNDSDTYTFTIDKAAPSREGSTFMGWSENANAETADYLPGGNYTATGQHTLYAVWGNTINYFDEAFEAAGKTKVNGYYAMQDMTEEICAAVPKKISEYEASTTQLIDIRDNKVYFVSKMLDGKCWMTQNLNYELDENGTTLDPATTSVARARSISPSDFEENQTYYHGFGNLMSNEFYGSVDISSVTDSLSDPLLHYLVGSTYTYSAATALAGKTTVVFNNATSTETETTTTENDDEEPEEPDEFAEVVVDGKTSQVKYSHTSNIDDTGRKNSNYGHSWTNSSIRGTDRTSGNSEAHVISIPGATSIQIEVYYNGESTSYDWVRIWGGSHPSYTANTSGTNTLASKLGGSCSGTYTVNGNTLTNMCRWTYTYSGDTVTFAFRSDGSGVGNGYGYYAIVSGEGGYSHLEDQGIPDYDPPKEEPVKEKPTAHSRTSNISETGRRNTGYGAGWNNSNITGTGKSNNSNSHQICLSNVDYLTVDIYYSTYNSYDKVTVSGTGLGSATFSGSGSGTYTINGNTVTNVNHARKTVGSNCVTFSFYSNNDGSSYYGYYAIVTGEKLTNASNKKIGTKYSYTNNLDQNGRKLINYGNNWGNANIIGSTRGDRESAHVITIPGANTVAVDIFYNTESVDNDWVSVWSGKYTGYNARDNYGSSLSGKLGGPQYGNYSINGNQLANVGHSQFVVSGNTVTISFTSNDSLSGDGYGYYAIVTGYGKVTSSNTKQATVQESICPKGWRLPHVTSSSNNEFAKLIPDGSYNDTAKRRYFINQPLYYTDTEEPVNYINDNSIEPLISTLKGVFSNDSTALGFVRCVAEETYAFTITFDVNGTTATAPDNINVLFTDSDPKSIMIPNEDISYPGYIFLGWSEDPNATEPDYYAGEYYTFDSSVELYAIWHLVDAFNEAFATAGKSMVDDEHYAMQDLTDQICDWLPEITTTPITGSLVDVRDNKVYNVAKLRDNRCWMVQDLTFGNGEEVTLSPATSDVEKDMIATVTPITNEDGTYYTYEAATVGFGRGLITRMTGDKVSNMSIENMPADSMVSICPRGWSLPSAYNTNYSFTTLLSNYVDDYEAFINDFNPTLSGVLDTANGSSVIDMYSGYWSPRLAQLNKSFGLYVDDSSLDVVVTPRSYAMGVRCIAGNNSRSRANIANLGTMQGVTPEIIANSNYGASISGVIDERDYNDGSGPTYSVTKMGDTQIWMTSSLRYEHEDGAVLDPYTSDVTSEIAFSSEGNENSYYVATPSTKYFTENGTVLSEREEGTYDQNTMGYYYTYEYATLNNSDGSSICPAGWQLPTPEMFKAWALKYNSNTPEYSSSYNTTGYRVALPYLNLGGYYTEAQDEYTDPQHIGEEGIYWSNTRISNRNARGFWLAPNAIDMAYPQARNSAAQVRCVTK